MNMMTRGAIGALVVFLASAVHSQAIEGLKLSIQCSNVVLSWPSVPGETYIVQYRPALATGSWQTLTNNLPAAATPGLTTFVHYGVVSNANCSGGSFAMEMPTEDLSVETTPNEFLAVPLSGSGDPAPLAIYPPDFDFTGFLIFNPATGQSLTGSSQTQTAMSASAMTMDDLEPPDDAGSGDVTNQDDAIDPDPGYYQVVRNGVHLYGISNGSVLSGTLVVPVEYGAASTDQISGFSYSMNGLPAVGLLQDEVVGPVFKWDTTSVTNGTYAIVPEINFNTDDPVDGASVTVVVSNVLFNPLPITSVFGSQMWILAQSTIFPANFQLDMYDSNTNYLGSFTGSTSDGVISFIWDLTDGQGYTFPDDTFTGQFTITPTGSQMAGREQPQAGSSITLPPRKWGKEANWSGLGSFVVACSAVDNDSTKFGKVILMVLGGLQSEDGGVVGTLSQQGLGPYVLSPGNVYGSQVFTMTDAGTRSSLLGFLGDLRYRNFYYFGHGSANSFGGGTTLIPSITASDLQPVLRNLILGNVGANHHPYRFVFIDGCTTGKGSMCERFGIPASTVNSAYFSSGAGVRSRAYLGFTGSVGFDPTQWNWRSTQLSYFFVDWLQGKTIDVCVSNAVHGVHQTLQPFPSSAIIFGAKDLTITSP
jgi:hypothetical protein